MIGAGSASVVKSCSCEEARGLCGFAFLLASAGAWTFCRRAFPPCLGDDQGDARWSHRESLEKANRRTHNVHSIHNKGHSVRKNSFTQASTQPSCLTRCPSLRMRTSRRSLKVTQLLPTHIFNQTYTDSVAAQVKSVDMVYSAEIFSIILRILILAFRAKTCSKRQSKSVRGYCSSAAHVMTASTDTTAAQDAMEKYTVEKVCLATCSVT